MIDQSSIEIEIRTMVASGTYNRSVLLGMLKSVAKETEKKRAPKEKRENGGPCTEYTSIKRIYTCMHCGHSFSSIVSLKKGESVPAMTREGQVMIITSKSPCEIETATSHCGWCEQFVRTLSREELEQRYMTLLAQSTFVTRFVQNLNIGRVVKL